MSERVNVPAPAKLNLWLRVFTRDARGFHAIETLFQLLSLADEVVVERIANGVTLEGAPPELGDPPHNLAVRAAHAFFRASGRGGGAAIRLHKRIPWQAGLGGASSDAAAVLRALNHLHGDVLPPGELLELGAGLGSDVPFFLSGAALALGWGRGERLLALPALPSLPALIVPPAAPVRTADAYAWIDKDRDARDTGEYAAAVPASALGSWAAVRRYSHNDFESAVAARLPAIGHWLDRVRGTEPFLVRLCGSGGAVCALYETERMRDSAWAQLGSEARMLRCETLERVPELTA